MRRSSLCLSLLVSTAVRVGAPSAQPVLSDSLYSAHHPRLMFAESDVAALGSKVLDGGHDDDAFDFIRSYVYVIYMPAPPAQLLGQFFGMESVPSLGILAHIASPPDPAVMAKGKLLTTFIADNYEPDFNEANSGMRLRALALGYDLFFEDATEAERASIRDEMVRYIEKMIWTTPYHGFEYRPYLGNHSAIFGAALGLAGICLEGEAEAGRLSDAIAMADRIVANLLAYQFDPGGSYNEGGLYALWTLRQLIYYFDARERFDGTRFCDHATVRAVEQWLPYELLPEAGGYSHNLNDSPYGTVPFARSTTYYDWAMSKWDSGLASWLFEHTAGTYGTNLGIAADKVGTVLWNRPVAPTQPDLVLPRHRVWLQRGLYHFRSEWQTGGASLDAVMFNFYSGKFQGGHAQEDQNQFSLYAYATKFVVDHGAGGLGKQSEAHNMVFIDGSGQHNAGSSIGTDGRIAEYLLGGSVDYLVGDATQAYTTYSEFNAPGVPFPGIDWSWGYSGANPVERAYRRVLAVHGGESPPYFVILDDIEKDGATHGYEWRLHTNLTNTVNTSTTPWTIAGYAAIMDVHAIHPPVDSLVVTTEAFDNFSSDPNSILLRVAHTAVAPRFSFLLIPRKHTTPSPPVSRVSYPWGCACTIAWGDGAIDYLVRNDSGDLQSHEHIDTDAVVAWVREVDGEPKGYLAAGASALVFGGTELVTIYDGAVTCELSGNTVRLDREDADFRFFDTGIAQVFYREQPIGFVASGGYVVPSGTTSVGEAPSPGILTLRAQPNPFNPTTTIRIDGIGYREVRLVIYDVAGRVVRQLWNAPLPTTGTIAWDGRDDEGRAVASGTYFLRASTASVSRTLKLTLLK